MLNSLDTLLGSVAANAALLRDDDADTDPSTTTITISTQASCATPAPQDKLPSSSTAPSAPLVHGAKSKSKKRNRNRSFTVFTDPPPSTTPRRSAPKKSKTGTHIPLRPRSPNISTAAPPPSSPDTPFRFSAADPFWSDTENHDLRPYTPPAPPPPRPAPSRGSAQPPRPLRPRRPAPPTAPRSMALYALLGISDWRASTEEIVAAWRRAALENHPDRVGEEEKDAATRRMQRLNAAKEVLSDGEGRRRYDVDGVVPWSEEEEE